MDIIGSKLPRELFSLLLKTFAGFALHGSFPCESVVLFCFVLISRYVLVNSGMC